MEKRIPLRNRKGDVVAHALVDEQDYEPLMQWHWSRGSGYATRGRTRGGRGETIRMHRQILGLERGDPLQADHINGDRLDNRRSNLRRVTAAQNRQNLACRSQTSRYRGVGWHKASRKWRAFGCLDRQYVHLGTFESEDEAGAVALAFRAKHQPYAVNR